jgi:hypothetical protein
MFFSSYTLLFLALAIRYLKIYSLWILFILALFCLVYTLYIIKKTKVNPDEGRLTNIQSKNEQVLGYMATYLLPYLGVSIEKWNEQIANLIIFTIICILYIKSDLIYINPTLMLLGYNIYEVTIDGNKKRILISKKSLNHLRQINRIEYYELKDRLVIVEKR